MTEKPETDKKLTFRAFVGFAIYLLLNPLIYFICAGRINIPMAWAYFGLAIVMAVVSRAVAYKKTPDMLEERARYNEAEGVKAWDKTLVPLIAMYGPLVMVIVAGLDKRFAWSTGTTFGVQVGAFVVGIVGYLLAVWAMLENRFFSALVRIQTDRGHTVCNTGPYRIMRHPGYVGGLIYFLVTPLILSSWWTFIPVGITVILTVIRTALEDRTLQEELPGYKEYIKQTRYRLVPGIW
ncbi:MAG: isoprenylcysteine carboxylmethyltransferase family protein [Anaerolineales bacterium]|nr:isoprenylcysteine carboxylmethyltransferase family protein [Anaerolineales bacterium]